ncbi:hypothetical protein SD427_00255 [Chryseobacterium sp. JJR-5R]|jgi:uncharacterized secreted protein with C-terminal beta-propeller domain|uniref:hypothetical protein n=1 Tax=Chryseobacterium sp. JJR-5R TaxID=3093923 RepID=UPI002A7661D2|nr:hypothetical protein [Chryseobacterium sp. JJR-5R]WPO82809.1 hypothetical protein SD427_00255 [Chryseobacterium sp. JJR-5R]
MKKHLVAAALIVAFSAGTFTLASANPQNISSEKVSVQAVSTATAKVPVKEKEWTFVSSEYVYTGTTTTK